MPRATREQIINTPAETPQRNPVGLDVVASPVDTFARPEENDLLQLSKALGAVHEPLARMQAEQDRKAKHDAVLEGQAAAARAADPSTADGAELAVGYVPPAFRADAEEAYREGVGQRLGIQAKSDFLDAYTSQHKDEGFNFEQFAADFRAKHLTGLSDPHLAIGAGKHIDEAIALARGDFRQFQQKQLAEKRDSAAAAMFSEIGPTSSPEVNADVVRRTFDAYVGMQGTRPEAAQLLLSHLQGLSTRMGGLPELFDLFDTVDKNTGKTLAELNPKLADNIQQSKKAAETLRDHNLYAQGLQTRSVMAADLERSLHNGEFDHMNEEQLRSRLLPLVSKDGLFNKDGEYPAFLNRIYERQAKVALIEGQRAAVARGQAATLGHAQQQERLVEATQPEMATILQGINNPQAAEQVNDAMRRIVSRTTQGGFDVGLTPLKQLIGSLENDIPADKATTPPKFASAARFYQDLKASGNPRLVAEYFSENMQHVMESYLRDTAQGQVGSDSAYIRAYEVISPEARKRAADMMKQPDAEKKVRDIAGQAVVSWWRRAMPFGKALGVNPDVSMLQQSSAQESLRFLASRPWATLDEASAHVERWAANNTFHDTATNSVVVVPQAMNSPETQKALTEWLGMVRDAWSKGDNKVTPRLNHKGAGIYSLVLESPNGLQMQGDVDLRDIMAVHQAKTNFNKVELEKLGALRGRLLRNELSPQEAADNGPLLQKATDMGVLDTPLINKVWALRRKQMESPVSFLDSALNKAPKVSPSAPLRDLDSNTVPVASQFLSRGDYAGALTAMGERVRLVAYKDPARGTNIGLGYNMEANSKTLPEDFRKAGIPGEYIDEIKAGRRAITVEQAVRLYDAVKPRYEKMAASAVGKEEWAKLPANAQAVLTDLAYQVGDISKFKSGLERVKAGDFSGAGLQAAFLDRHTQQRRVDERRHALRVAMLTNVPTFNTILSHAAKQPASPLEVRLASSGHAAP